MPHIEDFIGKVHDERDITYKIIGYDRETRKLTVEVSACHDFWALYLMLINESKESTGRKPVYEMVRHFNSDSDEKLNDPNTHDPMELWEWRRPGQKDDEVFLPQILLYLWHKDNNGAGRVSFCYDW